MSTKKHKFPSVWQMTKNFAKDLTKYISEGSPNVTQVEYSRRLSTCEGCEHFVEEKSRCGACGCLVEHKAKWKTATCPKKKWAPQLMSHGKIEEGSDTDSSDET